MLTPNPMRVYDIENCILTEPALNLACDNNPRIKSLKIA